MADEATDGDDVPVKELSGDAHALGGGVKGASGEVVGADDPKESDGADLNSASVGAAGGVLLLGADNVEEQAGHGLESGSGGVSGLGGLGFGEDGEGGAVRMATKGGELCGGGLVIGVGESGGDVGRLGHIRLTGNFRV